MNKAVILLSGGLDSSTCLAIAKSQGYSCHALSFSYDQKHQVELHAAARIAQALQAASHKIVTIDTGIFLNSALTDKDIAVPAFQHSEDIPVTYVPARNTIFLSIALAYAESMDASAIFIGASSVDYSHYPDCRPEYLEAFQTMANLAIKKGVEGQPILFYAPLQHLSKAETIKLGTALQVPYALTLSCYQLDANEAACGTCDSCTFRKKGFEEAGIVDPTVYA